MTHPNVTIVKDLTEWKARCYKQTARLSDNIVLILLAVVTAPSQSFCHL